MKAQKILIVSLMAGFTLTTWAQEYDDMYFNSSDRTKVNAQKATETYATNKTTKKNKQESEEVYANPTDSYSARNINPEYTSRSVSQVAKEDEQDYYLNNYQYSTANNYSNWNNNYNSWNNSAWYNSGWYGPSYGAWNSPYYNPYASWYGNSFYNDPFYNPYYYGSPWGGSGFSWGMSYAWGNPYYGYSPYSSMGNPWGWGMGFGFGAQVCSGWYYPPYNSIVVVNGDSRGPAYGKRSSRNSSNTTYTRSGGRNATVNTPTSTTPGQYYTGSRSSSGGRVATPSINTSTNTRQDEYYNRSWSRVTQQRSSSSSSESSGWTQPSNSSSRSSYNQNSNSFSQPSYSGGSNSRSSSGYSGGGSSGGSSGSSGGSRSRGGR